jgi:hypothetical protein
MYGRRRSKFVGITTRQIGANKDGKLPGRMTVNEYIFIVFG